MNLDILRNGVVVASVAIDEQTVLTKRLMNEDVISSSFVSNVVLPILMGDYVVYAGNNYTMNALPRIKKNNDKTFTYTIVFQSVLYELNTKLLISSDGLNEFDYTGGIAEHLGMVVENINSISAGWTAGTIEDNEVKKIEYLNENCRTALTRIAEAYQFEFEVVGKVISFKKAIGNVKPYSFTHGQNNGLGSIERNPVDNSKIVTKVYAYGGTKNLPYTYRDRQKRLVFESRFLEKNVAVYGIKEGNYTNDDIFPKRTSALTAVNMVFNLEVFNNTESYVVDTTLNFNITGRALEGQKAKIVFKSGDLANYEFEIWKHDTVNNRIYINSQNESDGFVVPKLNYVPKIGDSYTLVDLDMPYEYVIAAEQKLKDAAQVYIDAESVPKSLYLVKIDPKYAKTNNVILDAGDLVPIVDAQLGINQAIRVAEISFPLVNKWEMTAIIADFIPYKLIELVAKNSAKAAKAIKSITNNIENITKNYSSKTEVTNNYVTEYPETDVIVINGRRFNFTKHFDNILNPEILEPNDIIFGNYWDRYQLVKKWQFKGGSTAFVENYDKIETINFTPEV